MLWHAKTQYFTIWCQIYISWGEIYCNLVKLGGGGNIFEIVRIPSTTYLGYTSERVSKDMVQLAHQKWCLSIWWWFCEEKESFVLWRQEFHILPSRIFRAGAVLCCLPTLSGSGHWPGSSAPDGCWWHASRLRDLITPANSAPPDTAIGLVLEAAGAEMWNNGRLNIVLLIHNVHISHIHIRRIILNSIGDLRNWETIRRRRRILYNLQSIDIGQQWAQWALCPRCNNVHPPGVLCLARDTRYIGLSTALLTSIYYQP